MTALSLSHLAAMIREDRRHEIAASLPQPAADAMFNLMSRYAWREMSAADVQEIANREAQFIASHNASLAGVTLAQGWRDLAAAIAD